MTRQTANCPPYLSGNGVLVAVVGMPDPPSELSAIYRALDGLIPRVYNALMPSMAKKGGFTYDQFLLTSSAMRQRLSEPELNSHRRRTLRELFGSYKIVTEAPACYFVEELCDIYPNVRLILNTRAPSAGPWRHYKAKSLLAIPGQAVAHGFNRLAVGSETGVYVASRDHLLKERYGMSLIHHPKLFERHNAWVRRVAKEKNVKLLEWNEDDGWEPLCEFLGWEELSCGFRMTPRKRPTAPVRALTVPRKIFRTATA
ncbi:hypothetical protein BU16DRAFT_563712 [Lophium mytilinum]|uniref:Uncharacterized protein n=1 Tax=Lophium mytilinum TaxID=390894 RepID=A0A6A6QMR8_9PEZI|nr:hypothetical protein BU16DRAFT_563712 [Lophium mytilinum]